MNFLINLLVSGVVVFIASKLSPWVEATLWGGIIFALVLWILNASLWFLLRLVTFPLNFLTLGLVSLVISYFMIVLADNFVDWIAFSWFWSIVIFAIILAIINSLLWLNKDK